MCLFSPDTWQFHLLDKWQPSECVSPVKGKWLLQSDHIIKWLHNNMHNWEIKRWNIDQALNSQQTLHRSLPRVELWDVYCKLFGEKWPCDNGTELRLANTNNTFRIGPTPSHSSDKNWLLFLLPPGTWQFHLLDKWPTLVQTRGSD